MTRALDALAALISPPPDSLRLRTATVEAATATACTIKLAGTSLPGVPFLSSYAPAVGHRVLVAQTNAGVLIVLGRKA